MKCNCLVCDNYVIWDGDYVCCENLKLLSCGDENWTALNPENILKDRTDCNDFEKVEEKNILKRQIEMWNEYNPQNKVNYGTNLE